MTMHHGVIKAQKTPYFLSPWVPLSLNFVVFTVAYLLYDVSLPNGLVAFLVVAYSLSALLVALLLEAVGRHLKIPEAKVNFPRTTALIVILCSCLEYAYFGIPLVGDALYVEFGFPLIHHISVSSWILLFIARGERSRSMRIVLQVFAFANPIFMLNRDVMLLTLFCAAVLGSQSGKLKPQTLAVLAILSLIVFGLVGQIRSPFALAAVSLPFTVDVEDVSPLVMWPLIYITSSSFNMLANFGDLELSLYSDLINVFPESYFWATRTHTYFAIPLYYVLVAGLLWRLRSMSSRHSEWVPFYVYLVYQAYMSVFSVKVFTTNTIFVALAIALAAKLSSIIAPRSMQRLKPFQT